MAREKVRASRWPTTYEQPKQTQLRLRASTLGKTEAINTPKRRQIIRPLARAPSQSWEAELWGELKMLRSPAPTKRLLPPSPSFLGTFSSCKGSSSTKVGGDNVMGVLHNAANEHHGAELKRPLTESISLPHLALQSGRLSIPPASLSDSRLPPVHGQRTRTRAVSDELLSRSAVIEYLGQLQWFARLSKDQLQTLYSRAAQKWVPRYAAIIREGNLGSCFYILRAGRIRITSDDCGISFILPQDSGPQSGRRHVGEAALVARVRREATVTAVDNCCLLSLTVNDMAGLPVDLDRVRIRVVSNMLAKVPFFKDLPKGVCERLGAIMGVEYHGSDTTIFNEGDEADRLYVIVEGLVAIYRKNHEGVEEQVCTYSTNAKTPTFGELALWSAQPRKGTARTVEPCNLLVVLKSSFSAFLWLVPEFEAMFATYASAIGTLNQLSDARARIAPKSEEAPEAAVAERVFRPLPDLKSWIEGRPVTSL